MRTVSLNLSRKWRSQNFDQIVGQDLVVRILKNSLYSDHFFPVYLFAGQRGCGKTSTARVFAAAINCKELEIFQKNPKDAHVPCLVCQSCSAMREGNHPDFIEIDAASHTGVDNIRSIIESSSLLPLIGRKRVYLIDEAHMLSKAAFNAALKILEEPPSTALFILATTDHNKIIDTVRSRCFQLFFSPIAQDPLKNHLQNICKKEDIAYDSDALDLIVQHTQGSARDALNLLEQVKFASPLVSKQTVLSFLGHIGDAEIAQLIDYALYGTSHDLLAFIQKLNLSTYDARFVWERLFVLLRALLWLKYGVNSTHTIALNAAIDPLVKKCTLSDVHRMIDILYSHEEIFLKTTQQHIFLEIILLSLCQKNNKKSDDEGGASCAPQLQKSDEHACEDTTEQEEDDQKEEGEVADIGLNQWSLFVNNVSTVNDPLIETLFKQARFVSYDFSTNVIIVELSKDFILFKDRLNQAQALWLPILQTHFSVKITLDVQFTGENRIHKSLSSSGPSLERNINVVKAIPVHNALHKDKMVQPEKFKSTQRLTDRVENQFKIDVSDDSKWKIAPMLLRHFPGVITEVRENK